VLLRLARTVIGISTRAADRLGGVSVVQLRALTVLSTEEGGANLGRLAAGMGVTVSTASRLVDRLVRAGLLDRRPSPVSRREVSLALTPAGRELLERYDGLRLQSLRAGLAELPTDARPHVARALATYATALGQNPPVGAR
jgi:DNA-binding MarR family transcriptional regulator